ncbi:MAG: SRPBCC domain-containing protein [Acidobacteriia bacterium]|nr:SRPBCC domain-containing protein [Terriglobia bacterium]
MTASTPPAQAGIAIRLRHEFMAPREKVFRAWTDPEILKRWWCPVGFAIESSEIDLRAGGRYKFGMRKIAGGPVVYVLGSFLEVTAPEHLVYTWSWENAFSGMPPTRVQVRFLEKGAGTEVILIHENFPEAIVCLAHRAGWLAVWDRIAAAAQDLTK